jgi:predicted nucleic acid-binding Zn ribbon protein
VTERQKDDGLQIRGGAPRPLWQALARAIHRLGLEPGMEDARVFAEWEEAVGPEIARVAHPHRLDAGTLIVHVKNSAWMNELSLRRSEIMDRLNARRVRRRFNRIIFRLEI